MGGDRLALLPKGTSRKPGKKLLSGVGKRKGSSSWVSDFRGHSWSGPCSSLGNPTWNLRTTFCQLPLQGFKKCNLLRTLSTKAAHWCLWVAGSDSHAYSSMGWPGEEGSSRHTGKSTTALQDRQDLKTVGLLDRFTFANVPTGHFLGFVQSHKLCGRTHSYSTHNPDQLTLTSSCSRN